MIISVAKRCFKLRKKKQETKSSTDLSRQINFRLF